MVIRMVTVTRVPISVATVRICSPSNVRVWKAYRLVAVTPAVAVPEAVAVAVTAGNTVDVGEGAGVGSVARCRAIPTEVAPRPPSVTSSHACRRRVARSK
jgi:hypothetical protein